MISTQYLPRQSRTPSVAFTARAKRDCRKNGVAQTVVAATAISPMFTRPSGTVDADRYLTAQVVAGRYVWVSVLVAPAPHGVHVLAVDVVGGRRRFRRPCRRQRQRRAVPVAPARWLRQQATERESRAEFQAAVAQLGSTRFPRGRTPAVHPLSLTSIGVAQ